jgi:hypothetical protein
MLTRVDPAFDVSSTSKVATHVSELPTPNEDCIFGDRTLRPRNPRRFKAWMLPGPRQKESTIRRGSEKWKAPWHRPATEQDA